MHLTKGHTFRAQLQTFVGSIGLLAVSAFALAFFKVEMDAEASDYRAYTLSTAAAFTIYAVNRIQQLFFYARTPVEGHSTHTDNEVALITY